MTYVPPTTADVFNERFDKIEKVIPYNPLWTNGTGYYDYAVGYRVKEGVEPVKLEPGEEAKSTSDAPNNRKLIFMGTALGTAVFFERYTDGADGVIVRNVSPKLGSLKLINDGALTHDELTWIFGWDASDNIGSRLAEAFPTKK